MWTPIKCQVVIITAVLLANYVNAQLEVDDLCNHKIKGITGICKRLDECSTAIQDLKQGTYPQNCGFVGMTPIVCCTEAGSTPPPPPTTTTTTPTTPSPPPPPTTITTTTTITAKPTTSSTIKTPTGQLPVGEKSKQACKNFEILAYTKDPFLSDDVKEYELVANCPREYLYLRPFGNNSIQSEYPHMGLIGYGSYPDKYEWKCVGSLLSDKFVLTAAQCMDTAIIGEPQFVRLGDIDYASSKDDQYVQQINVKNRIKHPLYKSPALYHDIALLELERPAILSLYVKPICLYTLDPAGSQNYGEVTGWSLNEEGKSNNGLFKWSVRYFSTEACNLTYENDTRTLPRGVDAKIQVCYGPFDFEQDTCQSDLGGPIQRTSEDVFCSYYIFGITSFGRGCNHTRIPVGYVNLYPYIEWIEGIVWP